MNRMKPWILMRNSWNGPAICSVLLCFFFSFQAKSNPGLFESPEPVKITLSMDIHTLYHDRGDDPGEHPAWLSYLPGKGDTIRVPIKIRVRGHFRKDPANCNHPPLRLNFAKNTSEGTLFEGYDKVKLVIPCRKRNIYEQNVLKEYLAYKLYNLLTEESFRVRLVRITYHDLSQRFDPFEKFGFLIEPEENLARRNNCVILRTKYLHQEGTDHHKITVLSVFQYMIGNTDWSTRSVEGPHNIALICDKSGAAPVAVPYDFDMSGLVNAPYAKPAHQLGIKNVRIRLFRGFCRPEEEFQAVFNEFRQLKEDIYQTCKEVSFLYPKQLRYVDKYIDEFFGILDDPQAIKREFYMNCRTH